LAISSSEQFLGNIVVDIYDCDDEFNWVLLTRTDSSGKYQFVATDDVTETVDLTALLESMGVTRFRAIFSGLPSGYEFSPYAADQSSAYMASNVFPLNGHTPCWDLEIYGKGAIVWNAGITLAESSSVVPEGVHQRNQLSGRQLPRLQQEFPRDNRRLSRQKRPNRRLLFPPLVVPVSLEDMAF